MYYYRDNYFDQQIAFGVAQSPYARKKKPISAGRKIWNSVSQVLLSLSCLVVTFALGYMVMDVFGYEHLVLQRLDGVLKTLEMLTPTVIQFS